MTTHRAVPVSLLERIEVLMESYSKFGMNNVYPDGIKTENAIACDEIVSQLKTLAAPADSAPEPVAWRKWDSENDWYIYYEKAIDGSEPLYAHPPAARAEQADTNDSSERSEPTQDRRNIEKQGAAPGDMPPDPDPDSPSELDIDPLTHPSYAFVAAPLSDERELLREWMALFNPDDVADPEGFVMRKFYDKLQDIKTRTAAALGERGK